MNNILCVDLDGTLVKTDMLYESFLYLLKRNPLVLFFSLYWLMIGGKQLLKYKLAENYTLSPELLPYNNSVLDYCKRRRAEGTKLYLVSASNEVIVNRISEYLGIFDGCRGSDISVNLSGKNKSAYLNGLFGAGNYDYVGDSISDVPVWKTAANVVVVGRADRVKRVLEQENIRYYSIDVARINVFKTCLKAIRVHQWAKNLLLFVPLVTARLFWDLHAICLLFLAFISFSFVSSFVYVLNDILDLDSDRSHFIKRKRPFASGDISIKTGFILMPFFLISGLFIALCISDLFVYCILIYLVVTTLYSFKLKQLIIIDCLTLSFLYTFRMLSGIVILSVPVSLWLITFSGFFFLSLAVVKRMAELRNKEKQLQSGVSVQGRGYSVSDLPILSQIGVSCGLMSTLVFALYVNSSKAVLFSHPMFVYFCGPVLVFWFCYVFLLTHRGQMDEDPVMFAVKNKVSLLSGLVFIVLFLLGVGS